MTENTIDNPGLILKKLRIEKSLTLKQLAERTALPASTLSKIENGKMTLTYEKLVRLGAGLQEDLGRLLSNSLASSSPLPSSGGRRSVTRNGDRIDVHFKVQRHSYPASDITNKLMLPIIIDVTARSVKELGGLLAHQGEEYAYVLEGSMELHSEFYEPLLLTAGESVYFDSGMAHAYVMTGNEKCRLLVVCAGRDIEMILTAAKARAEPTNAKPVDG